MRRNVGGESYGRECVAAFCFRLADQSRTGARPNVTRLTARDQRRFQGLHRVSLTINVSNKPGNLLSLKSQIPRIEQIGFGHSSGTVEKQGRESKS